MTPSGMKRFSLKLATLVLLMPVFAAPATAQDVPARHAREGKLILSRFATAPFPHTNRVDGYRYQNTFYSAAEHYSDNTVGIFIPANFRPGNKTSIVIHFHGWGNNVTNVLEKYRLIEQFVASGRNAILVVPQGPRDAPDSSGGKLEEADGFKRFIAELGEVLQKDEAFKQQPFEIGDIILSGHSGGYKVIASVIERGGLSEHVREVWLFDALYGRTENFMNWFDSSHGRFVDIYTEHGGTKEETEKLIALLKQRGTTIYSGSEAAIEDLKSNRLVFSYSALAHDEVVAKQETFRKLLETSCLPSIAIEKPQRRFDISR